ncbi:MAG: CooT family nickel-binding protein [Dehalococcoidia bacterium]|nr:CooT family nickel-binding protein [Dehalococcoidia bacterium]
MCIATVYLAEGDEKREVMRDVVWVEAVNDHFRILNMFGEEKHFHGKLRSIDFWQEHSVVIEPFPEASDIEQAGLHEKGTP